MVKKLFKHECLAWLRVLPIIYGILLVVAALNRVFRLFETDAVYYEIIIGMTTFMYVVAVFVCMAAPVVFGISRFYRNLFTGEGYLSFTLPVTPANHLWVKSATAVAFSLLSYLTVALSLLILFVGEDFTEVHKAWVYFFGEIPSGHLVGYVAEAALLVLVSLFSQYLFFYACICLGQLFRKNRILAAVGVYFGFYVLSQILSTVFMVIMALSEATGVLNSLDIFIDQNPFVFSHIVIAGSVLLYALLAGLYYLICYTVIRKKLNLE